MDILVVAILCLSYAVNARQLWVYSCNKGFQEIVCACLALLGTTITTSWESWNCNSPYNGLQPKAQPSPGEKCRTCCVNVTKLGPAERVPRLFQENRQWNEKRLTSFQIWFASSRRQVPHDSSKLPTVDLPGCPSAVGPRFLTTSHPSTTLFKHPKNTLLEQDTMRQKGSVGVGSSVCNGQNFCN